MKHIFLFFSLFFSSITFGQYTLNGNAIQDNCHCYTLTQNVNTQQGSVWNNTKIDLSQSFDFTFQVFLGCNDFNGADGIAFVLQPISTSVGTSGGGMGFEGISPSVAVTLDTYQNSNPDFDPFYDHIAIQTNGNINHLSSNTLTPYTQISATNSNVEDCQNHTLRIVWNAVTKNMAVFFDNQPRVNATNDIVANIFGGNNLVYWGFTGATGGLNNIQKFCTQLTPSFYFLPNQKKCVNEPITFFDSTVSFSNPVTRTWDFGDGSPVVTNVVNPVHTYTTGGNFTVVLTVTSLDGCQEVFNQLVNVGSKPVAGFTTSGFCLNTPILFTDTSDVTVGTINTWFWDLDNLGITSTNQNTFTTYSTPGIKQIKFFVKTLEGCASDTLYRNIAISDRPQVAFTFTDSVCLGTPTYFQDLSTTSFGGVNYWQWNYSDSAFPATIQNPSHIFTTAGPHNVTLTTSNSGSSACAGTAVTLSVFVADKPVADMRDTIACERQSIQLLDSSYSNDGLAITQCWWDLGNGQFSNQCNPSVIFTTPGPKTIKHVVYNSRGCKSDTAVFTITVADKPIVKFGFNNPICNDSSLRFTDSSVVVNGNINQWNWIHNNASFSTIQNPTGYFPYGNNQVGLSVISNYGCFSDTLYKPFKLIKNPIVEIQFNDTCKYSPVIFTANETSTNIGINQWQWYFGNSQNAIGNPVTNTYTANGQYNITLYATSIEGCKDTVTDVINIYGTDADAGADVIAGVNQPIQLNATGGISYQWTPSTGLNASNVPNPVSTHTVTGDYTYYLKAYTPGGCESYDTIVIKVYKGPDPYLPSIFTPNNDNVNDVLKPFLVGLTKFEYFAIYNRYGQQIFYTTSSNKGWNGKFSGKEQPQGNYVWILKATTWNSAGGVPTLFKGSVLLVR